jgi:DNA-binding transcriptional ArsR family regulator
MPGVKAFFERSRTALYPKPVPGPRFMSGTGQSKAAGRSLSPVDAFEKRWNPRRGPDGRAGRVSAMIVDFFTGRQKFHLTTVPYFDNFICVKYSKPISLIKGEVDARHVEAFKALAHRSRLGIFFFLAREEQETPAGKIQASLKLPGPTLSRHLDLLRRAGLVQSRRDKRHIYYSVRPEMTGELVRLLTACC